MSTEHDPFGPGTIFAEANEMALRLSDIQDAAAKRAQDYMSEPLQAVANEFGYNQRPLDPGMDLIDQRVVSRMRLITPAMAAMAVPLSVDAAATTRLGRDEMRGILTGADHRLFVTVGPCSVHDPQEALAFASQLAEMRAEFSSTLAVGMRFHAEKPRTETGWKGLLIDPEIDGSNKINLGIMATRLAAYHIVHGGMPITTEHLYPSTPPYTDGLITAGYIGARSVTHQGQRELAAGLSVPMAFKNAAEAANPKTALEAIRAAQAPHSFLGMSTHGELMQITTTGNDLTHLILRGDENGPNHTPRHVEEAEKMLAGKGLPLRIGIDFSHGNSGKVAVRQLEVAESVSRQIAAGNWSIVSAMVESYNAHGKQPEAPHDQLKPNLSITDECIDLEQTYTVLQMLSDAVSKRRLAA